MHGRRFGSGDVSFKNGVKCEITLIWKAVLIHRSLSSFQSSQINTSFRQITLFYYFLKIPINTLYLKINYISICPFWYFHSISIILFNHKCVIKGLFGTDSSNQFFDRYRKMWILLMSEEIKNDYWRY